MIPPLITRLSATLFIFWQVTLISAVLAILLWMSFGWHLNSLIVSSGNTKIFLIAPLSFDYTPLLYSPLLPIYRTCFLTVVRILFFFRKYRTNSWYPPLFSFHYLSVDTLISAASVLLLRMPFGWTLPCVIFFRKHRNFLYSPQFIHLCLVHPPLCLSLNYLPLYYPPSLRNYGGK